MNDKLDWKKYVLVFIITAMLFIIAGYTSNFFNNKKIDQLKSIQDKISIDILSAETQFSLLAELSCKDVSNSVLSQELSSLAEKISYGETNIGNSDEIVSLKKYYSLLEIKDYLLMKKISERCGTKSAFALYFYSNKEDCNDCEKQGYALTALRAKYPELRVYSFDYNLDMSAIKAMISIYKVGSDLPAMVINGKVYNGFQTADKIEEILAPALKETAAQTAKEVATAKKKADALKATTKPEIEEAPVIDTKTPDTSANIVGDTATISEVVN